MKRTTNREARKYIANLEPFTNGTGSFRGVERDDIPSGTGKMPDGPERGDYIVQRNWGFLDYVVFSYATPIAWYSNRDGWHVTEHKYSVTTSGKHMNNLGVSR